MKFATALTIVGSTVASSAVVAAANPQAEATARLLKRDIETAVRQGRTPAVVSTSVSKSAEEHSDSAFATDSDTDRSSPSENESLSNSAPHLAKRAPWDAFKRKFADWIDYNGSSDDEEKNRVRRENQIIEERNREQQQYLDDMERTQERLRAQEKEIKRLQRLAKRPRHSPPRRSPGRTYSDNDSGDSEFDRFYNGEAETPENGEHVAEDQKKSVSEDLSEGGHANAENEEPKGENSEDEEPEEKESEDEAWENTIQDDSESPEVEADAKSDTYDDVIQRFNDEQAGEEEWDGDAEDNDEDDE